MKLENKLIENFKIIENLDSSDKLISDLRGAFKEKKGWPEPCHERCRDVIKKWLKIDNSQKMREALFLEILVSGSYQSTIQNHYSSLFLFPIKDILTDTHRATIWTNLSHLVAPSNNRNIYNFYSIIQVLVNDEKLEYKNWKKSIVNYCINNEKSDFLSILYLVDKTIFKLEHVEKLIASKKLASIYRNAFRAIKWPLKYNQKIEDLIEKSLINSENDINSIKNTMWLINNYAEQANLGVKFLPFISALSKEKQAEFSDIKKKLLMNKLDHEMQVKSVSGMRMKI